MIPKINKKKQNKRLKIIKYLLRNIIIIKRAYKGTRFAKKNVNKALCYYNGQIIILYKIKGSVLRFIFELNKRMMKKGVSSYKLIKDTCQL